MLTTKELDEEHVRATAAWRAPSPRNCVEIEVNGQPQRGEDQRAENARLLAQWTARSDIEGISWLQYGIREPLQHAGIARLCEARAERLHDPRCRRALDTGGFRRDRRAHSRSHHMQNARGRDLRILSHVLHRTSTALTSPTPSDGKANFTTVGPFVSGGHSNATRPHVVPPGATAFVCTSAFSTLTGACPSLVTRIPSPTSWLRESAYSEMVQRSDRSVN